LAEAKGLGRLSALTSKTFFRILLPVSILTFLSVWHFASAYHQNWSAHGSHNVISIFQDDSHRFGSVLLASVLVMALV